MGFCSLTGIRRKLSLLFALALPLLMWGPPDEVTAAGKPTPFSEWRLDETSGLIAADELGVSDGSYEGGVLLGAAPLASDSGYSASFDGVDDYVLIPPAPRFQIEAGTVSFFFNADVVGNRIGLFSRDSDGFDGGGHLTILIEANRSLKAFLESSNKNYTIRSAANLVEAGVNHHVALTFGPDGMKLYLDGALLGTDDYTGGLVGNDEPIVLGANQWASGDGVATPLQHFFTGRIDNLTLYDRALTQAEVQQLFGIEAYAGQDRTVPVGSAVTLDGTATVNTGELPVAFQWTVISQPAGSSASLTGADTPRPAFTADTAGNYEFQLSVSAGEVTDTDRVIISTVNSVPHADAGRDRKVSTGALVTLDGTNSTDSDGDGLTYAWSLVTMPSGSAAALSDPASPVPDFTADVAGLYVAELIVNDGQAASDPARVTVTTDALTPVADAGIDRTVQVATSIQLDGRGSYSSSGEELGYSWSLISSPSGSVASLTGAATRTPSFTVDVQGDYIAQLIVTDSAGRSAPDTIVISAGNTGPVASAGPDQRVTPGAAVTLDGGSSFDIDGDRLSYRWALIAAPQGSTAQLDDPASLRTSFTADIAGLYVAQLIVDDGTLVDRDTVLISTGNLRPVAEAGPDQTVSVGSGAALDGIGSSDPDNDPLTYQWSFASRPAASASALSDAGAVSPVFTPDVPGDYVVSLQVDDGALSSIPDNLVVSTVKSTPIANAGNDRLISLGGVFSIDGSASLDPDGSALAYEWSLIAAPAGSTAALSEPQSATPSLTPDVEGYYVAQLIVTDADGWSLPDTVVLHAVPNQPPQFTTSPVTVATEGVPYTYDADAVDPTGDPITYSLDSGPAGMTVDPATGVVNWLPVFVGATADVVLRASDDRGAGMTQSYTITVNGAAVNQPPQLGAIGAQTVDLGSTLNLTLTGSDPESAPLAFGISSAPTPAGVTLDGQSGAFKFRPDASQVGTVQITFFVSDGVSIDSETVTITVQAPPGGTTTTLTGSVLDAVDLAAGIETPVAGATVSYQGTAISTTTDPFGNFTLVGTGGGTQSLVIDGSTALSAPDGSAYSRTQTSVVLIADAINVADDEFTLARIDASSIATVDPAVTTTVQNVALGVTLQIPPNSARDSGGTLYTGDVSISAVPVSTANLPDYITPCQVVTIQPLGLTFSPVATATFPNSDNLPAGSDVDIWSIDPATGDLAIVGTGEVSPDGSTITTLTGGISASGMLFITPPAPGLVIAADHNAENRTPSPLTDGTFTVSHVVPGYRNQGKVRTQRFVYKSSAAAPRSIAAAQLTIPAQTALPNQFESRIVVDGVGTGPAVFTSASQSSNPSDPGLAPGETVRQALSVDAGALQTGAYPYEFISIAHYACSSVGAAVKDQILVDNRKDSSFGQGWSLEELSSLTIQQDGSVVVSEGDGTVQHYTIEPDILLEDDFNSENGGVGVFNYFGFQNWAVIAGGVDIIGNGYFDLQPGNGLYVDGDGTQLGGGTMQTLLTFPLRGDYVLTFRLAGNLRNQGNDSVTVSLGTAYQETITLPDTAEFATFTRNINVPSLINGKLKYQFSGGDSKGLLFDDVKLVRTGPDLLLESPRADFTQLVFNEDGSYSRTYPDGRVVNYDSQGRQTSFVDLNGNTTRYLYNAQNQLSKIIEPTNDLADPACATIGVTCFTYQNGLLVSVIRQDGSVALHEYDADGNRIRVVYTDTTELQYAYDEQNRLIAELSERGFVTVHDYGFAGNYLGSDLPDGSSIALTSAELLGLADLGLGLGTPSSPVGYSRPGEQEATITDGRGNVYTLKLNEFGSPVEITDPIGRVITLDRDADDRVIRVTRPSDGELPGGSKPGQVVTELDYDELSNVTALREAVGTTLERQTQFEYLPGLNRVTRVIDPAGFETLFDYDANGNLLKITDAELGEQVFTYDADGLLLTAQDANLNVTQFDYDTAGNLKTVTDALTNVTEFTRDGVGNVLTRTDGLAGGGQLETMSLLSTGGRTLTYEYDDFNRVTAEIDGEGGRTEYEYDAEGNRIRMTDPTGIVTAWAYDELNRMVQVNDPAYGVTNYAYDEVGNVIAVSDSLPRSTTFEYDAVNRNIRFVDALGLERLVAYDASDLVTNVTDAKSNVTSFTYDLLGRQKQRTNPLGEAWVYAWDSRDNRTGVVDAKGQSFTFTYDDLSRLTGITAPTDTLSFTWDPAGNLLTANDGDSSLTWTYDALNRTATATTAFTSPAHTATLTYEYDALSRRTALIDSEGGRIDTNYDLADGLVTQAMTSAAVPAPTAQSLTWDAAWRPTGITFPSGVAQTRSYDTAGRLNVLADVLGGTPMASLTHSYDAVGRVTEIQSLSTTKSFAYDAMDHILTGGTAASPESYSYDAEGNRETSHLSALHAPDDANRLVEDEHYTYTYDANGNLASKTEKTSGDVTTYVYDAFDRVLTVTKPDTSVITHAFDALGRRIEKNVAGNIRRYVYDNEDIVLEFDGSGTLQARYAHGPDIDQPLEMERGGQRYHYQADHLGSVRQLTDATGAPVNEYDYDAYGNFTTRTETVENPYAFTGREYDAESGLYYYRERAYDPRTGRFLQEDPIWFEGGDLNLYRYVWNDPVHWRDPSGLSVFVGEVNLTCKSIDWTTAFAAVFTPALLSLYEYDSSLVRSAIGFVLSASPTAANSFVAGTPVLMADGSTRPIELVQVGDLVMSRPEAGGETEAGRITARFAKVAKQTVRLTLRSDDAKSTETLTVTEEHPFHVPGKGWTAAGKLVAGDKISDHDDGAPATVKAVKAGPSKVEVFNLEVAEDHTYFAGRTGAWAHNSKGVRGRQRFPRGTGTGGRRFTGDQSALIDLVQDQKRRKGGVTADQYEIIRDWAAEYNLGCEKDDRSIVNGRILHHFQLHKIRHIPIIKK